MIDWKAMNDMSLADLYLVNSIVSRWFAMREEPSERSFVDIGMDLTACHVYGCPLDLSGLKEAKEGDFLHDLAGIQENINRETGELLNGFAPRYSARV